MKEKQKSSEIIWQDNIPHSVQFDDIYFSSEDGCEESRYVFLTQNNLPSRWQNTIQFCIAETGFGTGLNFLVTTDLWIKSRSAGSHLTYYSIEKFPLSLNDLSISLDNWPEFRKITTLLLSIYPGNLPGYHSLQLAELNITLVLMIGDVLPMLKNLTGKIDTWFLDGFSPSVNPEMWSDQVFEEIALHSHCKTHFATFTAAGYVRRGLQSVGFDVRKQTGFGRKREMLNGKFSGEAALTFFPSPWFAISQRAYSKPELVTIIGAGLAGLSCAWVLASQGIRCQIIESESDVGMGASGNHVGIVLPRFTLDQNVESQFYVNSFLSSVQWFNSLKQRHPQLSWRQSGVFQAMDESRLEKIRALQLPEHIIEIFKKEMVNERCGLAIDRAGLFYPQGGYLNPKQLCLLLAEQLNLSIRLNVTMASLVRTENNTWVMKNDNEEVICESKIVILASGYSVKQLGYCDSLQVQWSRGQVSYFSENEAIKKLTMPLCYGGYVTPAIDGLYCLGATYDNNTESSEFSLREHEKNIAIFVNATGISRENLKAESQGRVSFRTTSQDHLPIVGPVMDESMYRQAYMDLHHGRLASQYPAAPYQPDLYLTTGHGSRGLVSCYSSACYLAQLISGRPLTFSQPLISALHPARYLIRQLKKNRA